MTQETDCSCIQGCKCLLILLRKYKLNYVLSCPYCQGRVRVGKVLLRPHGAVITKDQLLCWLFHCWPESASCLVPAASAVLMATELSIFWTHSKTIQDCHYSGKYEQALQAVPLHRLGSAHPPQHSPRPGWITDMPPIEHPPCGLAQSQSIPSSQEFELLEGSVREQPVVFHHLVWTGRVLAGTT